MQLHHSPDSPDSVPNEILCEIFLACGPESLGPLATTCTRWHSVVADDYFWTRVFDRDFGGPRRKPQVASQYKLLRGKWPNTSAPVVCDQIRAAAHDKREALLLRWSRDGRMIGQDLLETVVYRAAQEGLLTVLRHYIEQFGRSLTDSAAADGSTPLYIAAQNGHAEVVAYLLSQCPSHLLEKPFDHPGHTPLYVASQKGHATVARLLIAAGANVHISTVEGDTPLYIASQEGSLPLVKLLLDHGADTEAGFRSGFTAVYVAARNGHHTVVSELVARGAALDNQAGDGSSPLYVACQGGHFECAVALLAGGADPTAAFRGYGPLYIASQNGHADCIRALFTLSRLVIVDEIAVNGSTALYVAAQNGHLSAAEALLKHGAHPCIQFNGYTPLYIAAQKGHTSVVALLLRYPATDVDLPSPKGATPLYVACQKNHVSIAKLLVEHGADQNATFQNGFTALHIAAQESATECVALLLEQTCIHANAKCHSGRTALDVAETPNIRGLISAHLRKKRRMVSVVLVGSTLDWVACRRAVRRESNRL